MNKKDSVINSYFSIPEVFADLFNVILFDGKKVLEANTLITIDSKSNLVITNEDKSTPKEKYRNDKGGIDMCPAIREIEERGIRLGEERGEERGIRLGEERERKRMNKLIQILTSSMRIDDLIRVSNDTEYQQQLFKEFNI